MYFLHIGIFFVNDNKKVLLVKFLGNDFSVLAIVHVFGMTKDSEKKKKDN